MTIDPHPFNYDPKAFPAGLRLVSLALSVAVVGIILFQVAATTALFA